MYFPGTCRKQAKCLTFFTFSSSEKANSPPNCKNPPPPYEIPESSFPDSDFFFQNMMIMMTAMDLPRDMHSHILCTAIFST